MNTVAQTERLNKISSSWGLTPCEGLERKKSIKTQTQMLHLIEKRSLVKVHKAVSSLVIFENSNPKLLSCVSYMHFMKEV